MKKLLKLVMIALLIPAHLAAHEAPASSGSFRYDGQKFTYQDAPAAGRIQVGPSMMSAFFGGYFEGSTYGLIGNVHGNVARYKAAAQAYLNSTGRNCDVGAGGIIDDPVYEFGYTCN